MVRVVYRWHVAPENFEEFKKIWSTTTNRIHESVFGALGSFMLRSFENETEVITIAKWDSLESWKNFWGNENPQEMEARKAYFRRSFRRNRRLYPVERVLLEKMVVKYMINIVSYKPALCGQLSYLQRLVL